MTIEEMQQFADLFKSMAANARKVGDAYSPNCCSRPLVAANMAADDLERAAAWVEHDIEQMVIAQMAQEGKEYAVA